MTQKTQKILKIVISVLIAALTALAAGLGLTSCGSTKVTVDKPASGTQTTITVTTNNPISTDVNPSIDLKKGE